MGNKKDDNLMASILVGGVKVKAAMDLDSAARDLAEIKRIGQQQLEAEERERDRREQFESQERRRRDEAHAEEERQNKIAQIEMIRQKGLGIHLEQLRTVENIALQRTLTIEEAAQQFRKSLIESECGFLLPDASCPPEQTKEALRKKYDLSFEEFSEVEAEHVVGRPFATTVDEWRVASLAAHAKSAAHGERELVKATKDLERFDAHFAKIHPLDFGAERVYRAIRVLRRFPSPVEIATAGAFIVFLAWMRGGFSFLNSFCAVFLVLGVSTVLATAYVRWLLSGTLFHPTGFLGLSALKGPPRHTSSIYGVLEVIAQHLPPNFEGAAQFESSFWSAVKKEPDVLLILLREANPRVLKSLCVKMGFFEKHQPSDVRVAEVFLSEGHSEKLAHLIAASGKGFGSLSPAAVFRLGWYGLAGYRRLGKSLSDVADICSSELRDLRDQEESMQSLQALTEAQVETDRAMLMAHEATNRIAPGAIKSEDISELKRKIQQAEASMKRNSSETQQKLSDLLAEPTSYLLSLRRGGHRAA